MTNRIVLSPTMIRVSKAGVDVLTASSTSPDNFYLSSDTRNLGVYFTGQFTVTDSHTVTNPLEVMFPFTLNFMPFVLVQRVESSVLSTAAKLSQGIGLGVYVRASLDRLFVMRWAVSTSSQTFRYVVFYANAGE